MVVNDTTGKIQVALWNDKAKQQLKSGDTVKMTYVSSRHNTYLHTIALSSTTRTSVQVHKFTMYVFIVRALYTSFYHIIHIFLANVHCFRKCSLNAQKRFLE